MIRYYDGHVHYNHKSLEATRKEILAVDYDLGVVKAVNAASTMNSNFFMRKDLKDYVKKGGLWVKQSALPLIRPKGPEIKFAIGKDPIFVGGDVLSGRAFQEEKELHALAEHEDVCAIKTGLNYMFGKDNCNYQLHWFHTLVQMALTYDLPLNLAIEQAHDDALQLLQNDFERKHYKGVILNWNGSPELAVNYLDMGFLLGIGGRVFYDKAVQQTVKDLPLENFMLETDFPRNHKKLPEIAKEIAAIKNLPLETVAEITYRNGEDLYG